MNIKDRIGELKNEMIDLRRMFHRHPELGFEEWWTQEQVVKYLTGLSLEVSKIAGTGVVALLHGVKPGKTVLLRSDMDALPIEEETGLPYASEVEGKMHACGHDGHMAMLLIAAKVLKEMQEDVPGTIKFIFQPNEEDAGAYRMVDEGVMTSPKVDAAFGIHLWSQIRSGTIDIVDGPQMAASHYFYLTITGKGGHAGFAHESIDPILVASNIVQSVQAVQTREIDALNPAVIMFTEFHAGSNTTIVPEKVRIKGSIRFLYEGGDEILRRFERIIAHTCEAHRVSYELSFKVGNNLLSNDPEVAQIARETATEVLGEASRVTTKIRTMAGEDFSDYLQHAPGAFAFVGIANRNAESDYPHHHPRFTIDEEVLPAGAELHVRMALRLASP
ncbi:MAG: amidohydrolase [Spirochaetaceae bacterium]|nr:MAG: amidohydrolase [Spirochaetaceae bacterium]